MPDFDHTVRAKVTGLTPKTTYYYRFVAGSDISATGTTRTAPSANEANPRVRFAWFVCQNWSANHWQAMSLLAAETDSRLRRAPGLWCPGPREATTSPK